MYIFVGSADKAGTPRNPLPIDFRVMLIMGSLHEVYSVEDMQHIHVIPLEDMTDESDNSHTWGRYLFMKMFYHTKDTDMTIYYSDKPEIMLSWFDNQDRWCLRFKFLDRYKGISATLVRNTIKHNTQLAKHLVPDFVSMHLNEIVEYLNNVEDKEE